MAQPVSEKLLDLIRPEVRAQRPYIVPGAREVPVKLNQNESPFDLPTELKRDLLTSFLDINFNRYPDAQPGRLIAALEERSGVGAGSLIVGNGSNELTYTLGMCFVHPGDHVVVPRPMFALFETMIKLHGGIPVGVAPRSDLHFDVDGLISAIETHQPKLVILATPNNPTGLAMPSEDILRIVRAAPGFVVVDEAYHEFNAEPSAIGLLEDHPNVIVLRTLSKAYGLAGLRLGYMVARPKVIAEIMKSRLPFMIDRLSEHVGLLLLSHYSIVADGVRAMQESTADLIQSLSSTPGVEVLPSQTNFALFKTRFEPGDLLNKLADEGTLVRNMSGYPELQGYLRVTSGTPEENKAFLIALDGILKS